MPRLLLLIVQCLAGAGGCTAASTNNGPSCKGTTAEYVEAVKIAMTKTTIDMDMDPDDEMFPLAMKQLLQSGAVKMGRVDVSVGRVLQVRRPTRKLARVLFSFALAAAATGWLFQRVLFLTLTLGGPHCLLQLKKDLGLLADPFLKSSAALVKEVGSVTDRTMSLNAARESLTLLRNSMDATVASNKPRCSSIVLPPPPPAPIPASCKISIDWLSTPSNYAKYAGTYARGGLKAGSSRKTIQVRIAGAGAGGAGGGAAAAAAAAPAAAAPAGAHADARPSTGLPLPDRAEQGLPGSLRQGRRQGVPYNYSLTMLIDLLV